MKFVKGEGIRDVNTEDSSWLIVKGRNDMGLIEYVFNHDDLTDVIAIDVFVDKKCVTDEYIEDIENEKSLAVYRGGKSTRLVCDIIRRSLTQQHKQGEFHAEANFMMYIFSQVDFVCKENIEDVLGVNKIKDSKELLKEIREDKLEDEQQTCQNKLSLASWI